MKNPLLFLIRFAVTAGVFYGIWEDLAPLYLKMVVPAVNFLFSCIHLPVLFEQQNGILLLAYHQSGEWIRLQAHAYDVVYLNLIVAVALVFATPNKPLQWKLKWSSVMLILLWISHLACFLAESQIAIWRYLDTLPNTSQKKLLIERVTPFFPLERSVWYSFALDRWNIWGRYGMVVGIWFLGLRKEIGKAIGGLFEKRPERTTYSISVKSRSASKLSAGNIWLKKAS